MLINLSTLYAGPRGTYGPGKCDVPDDIAMPLIEAQLAVPVAEIRKKAVAVETLPTAAADETTAPARRSTRRAQTLPTAAEDDGA